ncbi:MAG: hypothetical protein DHS20C02_09890 [Micavibrio sp.]|nr:MAG: hypothetical protein DHS20C02_09890 [Micavibrio sp.]
MTHFSFKETLAPTLSLFASAGTLICCALPALFVTLGMGAALAGLVSDYPQLVWLSERKVEVFGFATFMLTFAGIMQYRARNMPCPVDPIKAKACTRLRKISLGIYIFSLFIFLTGVFFAFVAPKILF